MTYKLPDILSLHSPGSGYNPVTVSRIEGGLDITILDEVRSFAEQDAERKFYQHNSERRATQICNILEAGDSVPLANVGVSAAATLDWQGEEYAIIVSKSNTTRSQLISGYTEAEYGSPDGLVRLMGKELSEELIVVGEDGLCPVIWGTSVLTPYDTRVTYANQGVSVIPNLLQYPPHLDNLSVTVNTQSLIGDPVAHIDAHCNCVQLDFALKVHLPDVGGLTLMYAEEGFDPAHKKMKTTVYNEGLMLFKMKDGNMTKDVFRLVNGELVEHQLDPKFRLSEIFVPPTHRWNIRSDDSISLDGYLNS